jgi:hypothetical protein
MSALLHTVNHKLTINTLVIGRKPIMLRTPSCPNSFDSYHSMPVTRLGPSSLAWLLAAHSLDGD